MDVDIIEISCATCGISFWIVSSYQRKLVRDGNSFFCPGGHSNTYGPGDKEQLRKRVASLEQTLVEKERLIKKLNKGKPKSKKK